MKTYIRGGSQFGPLNECGCAASRGGEERVEEHE